MSDILVVGSGFFGSTFANLAANDGKKVTVIEKRSHIGGNSYSEIDKETNIEFHKYGSHIFHTSNEKVWKYVNKFSKFNNYIHHVITKHKDRTYSMPINLDTINSFYKKSFSPEEAKYFINNNISIKNINNLEDKAISLIGTDLYEAFIKGYTQKQWQTDPNQLPEEIINRLPVRYNYNNRYFSDKYEGIPIDGYTSLISKMLDHKNINIMLNTDFFDLKNTVGKDTQILFTGPIDKYYDYEYGELGWRTLDFKFERYDVQDYQGTSVINYADLDVPYTRVHEFKHLHPERKYGNSTLIAKEYSRFALKNDEPYYPINLQKDKNILGLYRQKARKDVNITFGGRLGTYQYLDMHMAIASAIIKYKNNKDLKIK